MPLRKRSFTSELLTQQQGEILKVGFLRKKGHVRRNWLDRWFVLTTEGIYYYKNRLVCVTTAISSSKQYSAVVERCTQVCSLWELN